MLVLGSRGIVVCLAVLCPIAAQAQWTTDLFLGQAWTQRSNLKIEQPGRANALTFHHVEYEDRSLDFPLYYGLRVGHDFGSPPFLGVELEFIHAKAYTNPEQQVRVSGKRGGRSICQTMALGDIVQRFSISHGVNIFTLNLVGHIRLSRPPALSEGRSQLEGRVGIGPALLHPESTVEGDSREQYQWSGPAILMGAGLRTRIWRKLNLLMEYKFTYVRVAGAKIHGGTARTRLGTHHLAFGMRYSW